MKEFFNKIKSSLKLTLIAIFVAAAGLLIMINWILPNENDATIEVAQLNNLISSNYDKANNSYRDPEFVGKLQKEAIKKDSELSIILLFRMTATFIIVLTLIGLGAWYLQYIYTALPFTKNQYEGSDGSLSDNERQSKMIVLASALLSATIIAAVLFNQFFRWQ